MNLICFHLIIILINEDHFEVNVSVQFSSALNDIHRTL